MESEDQHHLRAAEGYAELEMFARAVMELEAVTPETLRQPKARTVQLMIYQGLMQWSLALEVAEVLCMEEPDDGRHFLSAAFCLHELKRTSEARAVLLAGPATSRRNWVFHYNMACYDAQLGDLASARAWLETAVKMNPDARVEALDDPDLKPLRQAG